MIFSVGKYTARHDYFAKTKVGAGSRHRNHDVKSSQISGVSQVRACWPKGLTPSGHDHLNHALDETTPWNETPNFIDLQMPNNRFL